MTRTRDNVTPTAYRRAHPEPAIKTRNIPLRDGRGSVAVDLILAHNAASINIRGSGIISLADAKYLLDILEDFVGMGDDHEHAEAEAAYYRLHPEEVDA